MQRLTYRPAVRGRFLHRMGPPRDSQLDLYECLGECHGARPVLARLIVQDLVIDWSLFRPNAKLLRRDRGYSNTYVRVEARCALPEC
jgi:hypothetical protein